MKVIKRDGSIVPFNIGKIIEAINKAFINVDGSLYEDETARDIAEEIAQLCMGKTLSVEQIQDLVEKKLMMSERPDVAKSYILYRERRTVAREKNNRLVQAIMRRNDAYVNDKSNANVDETSFSGREKEASADIQKIIALDYILSPAVAQAHKDMLIYQHDLEKTPLGVHNCLFIDFEKMFAEGFSTRNGDIRTPGGLGSAMQLIAVIFQCQSQIQFGGAGAVKIDTDLVPYAKKSFVKHFSEGLKYLYEISSQNEIFELYKSYKPTLADEGNFKTKYPKAYQYATEMLEKEASQGAEALYHNLNTLESRAGSQVPFTSINFGRETSLEGRLITKALIEASLKGIGKYYLTPIFPISIFQYKKGCNADNNDINYDLKQLALKGMSKRIYPNWLNCGWSQANEDPNNPNTRLATMGCRTSIGYDRHGLGYQRVGRGNNVPVTIILPQLGIKYGICGNAREKADLKGFFVELEQVLSLAEQALLERFDIMVAQSPAAAPFMYKNGTVADGQKCKDTVYNALRHNTLGIGYIGIAETCQALFGKNHAEDDEVHSFALKVVARINAFAKEAAERNDLNFACYATPAEGLCYTAVKALRKQHGLIKNVTDKDFLTNSHHIPVWHKIGIFDKLRKEAPFCKLATAGVITYIELDSTCMNNTKAIEQIIDYAFEELDIPYLTFNFPIDSCLNCGHQGEFNDACPLCNCKEIQQLRRVTGYLSTDYRNFNLGKQAEVEARVKHLEEI